MSDEKYEIAFQVIMNAGNSKSSSMMAIEAAREFDFEEAERLLKEADKGSSSCTNRTDTAGKQWKWSRCQYNSRSFPRPFINGNNGER